MVRRRAYGLGMTEAQRKIIVTTSVSLDGFIEGPNREIDWHVVDRELHAHFNENLKRMGAFLEGRAMYELMARVWPHMDQNPAATPEELEYAGIWLNMPKIVYSRTLQRAHWNTTIVRDVVPDEVRALKALPGGDLSLGGAGLTASFLRHDLVDEFWIYVHPVAIGRGKPLFPPGARISLRLEETRRFGNGVVLLRYTR